jgi:hypothetical protein
MNTNHRTRRRRRRTLFRRAAVVLLISLGLILAVLALITAAQNAA